MTLITLIMDHSKQKQLTHPDLKNDETTTLTSLGNSSSSDEVKKRKKEGTTH